MGLGLYKHYGKVRRLFGWLQSRQPVDKKSSEIAFWREYIAGAEKVDEAAYYRKFITDMAGINDESFFDNKIVLDIGCGPRGSLVWMSQAKARIGLDPLAEDYMEFGISDHNMLYICSGAESIPFPSGYVDIVISMNSLDHVDNLPAVCSEIRRVLKPGGHFLGSINLNEPPTACEPWTLTEDLLAQILFMGWDPEYYIVRPRVSEEGHFAPYKYFYEPCPQEILAKDGPQALWCRFRKN